MTDYARCFEKAAETIDKTEQFPGQIMAGVWNLYEGPWVPPVIIGVIIANAVAAAAKECEVPFDFIMARYDRLMADQPVEVKGTPDRIAKAQLLRAAAVDRAYAHRSGEDAQISLEDAAAAAISFLSTVAGAEAVSADLSRALESSRRSHDGQDGT